jgi:asparagine synthase (glutamine-hydrolysing)
MCGIAGYVGPEWPGALEQMTARVAHRGPDGSGYWHDASRRVHFGHSRLAIIDRVGGAQPMGTSAGDLVVVFNGEIYNAPELRTQLQACGHRFASDHADTEVLLHGYREWGLRLPEKLNGMWAFVIHDRAGGRLFASRDRFGEKPFYYAQVGGVFLFGSELGALRAHPACPGEVDRLSLKKYFAHGFIPAPRTMLSGVSKLPGGHSLVYECETGRLAVSRHWAFLLEPDDALAARPEDQLAEELRERLRRAVRRQLVADVGVGALLSGGVDSSAIAALAVEARGRGHVASFSLGFEEPTFDESGPARAVAEHLGTVHHAAVLDAATAAARLPALQLALDEPVGDPSILPTHELCGLAKRHVGVVLSGDGGDELFAGYDTFRALRAARAWTRLPRPVHAAIRHLCARLPVAHGNLSWDFKVKRFLRGAECRPALWHPAWLGPLDARELAELFNEPVNPEEIYAEAIAAWDAAPAGNEVDRALQFFTRLYLQDGILTKVDRASMLHGLEVRSPFLDLEVADFARRLPSSWKLRGGRTKYLLKRALTGMLPGTTIHRPKKGFGLPVGAWFRQERLPLGGGETLPGLDRGYLAAARRAHLDGVADHRQLLWCAGMAGAWAGGSLNR